MKGRVVHSLAGGFPPCGFTRALPRDWPPGHVFSHYRREVNCKGCRATFVKGENDPALRAARDARAAAKRRKTFLGNKRQCADCKGEGWVRAVVVALSEWPRLAVCGACGGSGKRPIESKPPSPPAPRPRSAR